MTTAQELTAIARQLHIAGLAPQKEAMLAAEVLYPGSTGGLLSTLTSLVGEVVTANIQWCVEAPGKMPSDSVVALDAMTPPRVPGRAGLGSDVRAHSGIRVDGDFPADASTVEPFNPCAPLGSGPRLDAVVLPRIVPGVGPGGAAQETHWVKAKVTLSVGAVVSQTIELPALGVPVTRIEVPVVVVGFMYSTFNPSRGVAVFTPTKEADDFLTELQRTVDAASTALAPIVAVASLIASRIEDVPMLSLLGDLVDAFEYVSNGLRAAPSVAIIQGECDDLNDFDAASGVLNDVEVEDELCSLIFLCAGTEEQRVHWRAWIDTDQEGGNLTLSTDDIIPFTLVPSLPTNARYAELDGDLSSISIPPGRITVRYGEGFRNCLSSCRWEDVAPSPV